MSLYHIVMINLELPFFNKVSLSIYIYMYMYVA